MRVRGLLVLAVIAGGLAWGLWSTQKRAAREEVSSEALLGGRRLADATRIVVQRAPDLPALHFARPDPLQPFMLVEPIVDLASAAFVDQLRNVLETAQRFLDGPLAEIPAARLQQMGLAPPRGRIEVRYPDRTFALGIGLEGPLHQDLYIAMDGNAYRTGLAVWTAIQVNPDGVRERVLVQTHPEDIRRLELRRRLGRERKEETVEVERTGSETFRLLQPLQTSADPASAAALFSFLSGMVAEQFLTTLNEMPEWDVQIEIESARGIERLTVWNTEQGLIGRQEPRSVDFTIKSVNYSRTFEVPVDELRARILVPLAMADIGRIEIDPGQGGGERIQLRRAAGDAIHLFLPVAVETEPAPVNDLLQATQKLTVVEFVDAAAPELAKYGLDRGFLTVSLHPRLQETRATVLHFGRDDGEHTFVKRGDEALVAKVPKAVVDALRQPWWTYATRRVGVTPPADTREIRYVVQGSAAATLTRAESGKWRRAGSDADAGDQAAELLEIAAALRGRRTFDAQEPAAAAELAAARQVQIEFAGPPGGAVQRLVLWDRGTGQGGSKQAWVVPAGNPRIVVELGPADTQALLAPLGK